MALLRALALFGFVALSLGAPGRIRGHQVAVEEVQESLQETMQAILRGGSMTQHLEDIERSIWQTYQSLPKNEVGHIGPRAIRYLVHNYFAKEHGWLIKGLEPHGHQQEVSEIHEVSILQDKAPMLVESLLEAQRADRGLSLMDAVAMVATLERLIFDEALLLLHAAYNLNSVETHQALTEQSLHQVLTSYLVLFEMGQKASLENKELHRALKSRAAAAGSNWPLLVEFEEDAVRNYAFARRHERNPFDPETFTFAEAEQIIEGLTRGYGKWQNTECQQMKQELMELDVKGMGRVPLAKFYSQPENAEYHFTETQEYLRQVGALDETRGEAYVRIANYMTGPSNCIASSSYYSVCCLNECEGLMNELESKILAPAASVERLLGLVANMSSATVDAPRSLPRHLAERLQTIAERHEGEVPLHGRLFAQWLHHAFPNECPFPHITEAAVLAPGHWMDKKAVVSKTEREELAGVLTFAEDEVVNQTALAWSEDEVLAAYDPKVASTNWVRVAMQLALLLGLLRTALGMVCQLCGFQVQGKGKQVELPF